MRRVSIAFNSRHSASFWWGYLSGIDQYEKYIPFIQNVIIHGPLKEGSCWCDVTTIAFFPFRIRHNIKEWKKDKKIVFEVPQPVKGGMVRETIFINSQAKGVKISGTIDINYPKGIIYRVLEWFLSTRFEYMLKTSFKSIEKEGLKSQKIL